LLNALKGLFTSYFIQIYKGNGLDRRSRLSLKYKYSPVLFDTFSGRRNGQENAQHRGEYDVRRDLLKQEVKWTIATMSVYSYKREEPISHKTDISDNMCKFFYV
jgi:hypothetical protein